MRALYCHPAALMYLRTISAEAPPEFPGTLAGFLGTPVIEDNDLPFSGWQLRDGGEMLAEGRFFEEPEPPVFDLPPFSFDQPAYNTSVLRDYLWSQQFAPLSPLTLVTGIA